MGIYIQLNIAFQNCLTMLDNFLSQWQQGCVLISLCIVERDLRFEIFVFLYLICTFLIDLFDLIFLQNSCLLYTFIRV